MRHLDNRLIFKASASLLAVVLLLVAPARPVFAQAATQRANPLAPIGAGDTLEVQVYGQPNMNGPVYVARNGTITLPLLGAVPVAGLSPIDAAVKIEQALKQRQLLVDPVVTIAVTQSSSRLVSVLGDVARPGRYPIGSDTNVIELLAEAGGETAAGANFVYVLRPDASGHLHRFQVPLNTVGSAGNSVPTVLRPGDSIYVPAAPLFYVYGQVGKPGAYPLQPGMTVVQALSTAGGVTNMGTTRGIRITRTEANGRRVEIGAGLNAPVEADDVIRVKESIF